MNTYENSTTWYSTLAKVILISVIAISVGFVFGFFAARMNSENENLKTIFESTDNQTGNKAPPISSPDPSPEPSASEAPSASPIPIGYFVKATGNNMIAVYLVDNDGETTLIKNIEIALSALPENDRLMLREGISVATIEDVASLLEDFSS